MGFARKHWIISGVAVLLLLFIALGAIAGAPKKKGGNTAPKIAQLPVNEATTDPRWTGLADCLTAHGIQNGATNSSLNTYGMTTSSGGVIGNVTYSGVEQFKYGPVSWTFATDPAPPAADETAVTDCIHETFGPNGRISKYVKKYASPGALNADAADRDPHWAALRTCLKSQGLSYFYQSDFPSTLIVNHVGAVDYGKAGPGTPIGNVKYIFDTNPPPKASDRPALTSCLHQEY